MFTFLMIKVAFFILHIAVTRNSVIRTIYLQLLQCFQNTQTNKAWVFTPNIGKLWETLPCLATDWPRLGEEYATEADCTFVLYSIFIIFESKAFKCFHISIYSMTPDICKNNFFRHGYWWKIPDLSFNLAQWI